MNEKKTAGLILLLLLCLALAGCRTRTGVGGPDGRRTEAGAPLEETYSSAPSREETGDEGRREKNDDSGERTKENPEASRKEYDEQAPVQVVPGTQRAIHARGEGGGASVTEEQAEKETSKESQTAAEKAVETVAADQAEQRGVSADGAEADSALTYYTVLIQDRAGSLFECQRLSVYWETAQDHVTVFKTSPEHSLIVNAGAYDVSARLLRENLRVDDGWIGRKNPGVIVKAVESGVLGPGVSSTGRAQAVYASLLARPGFGAIDAVRNGRVILLSQELLAAPYLQTAAMLMILKTANPALMEDVDVQRALNMLAQEATGSSPSGYYFYNGQGGF